MKPGVLISLLLVVFMITSAGICKKDSTNCHGFSVTAYYDDVNQIVTAQPTGGQAPISYTWSHGKTGAIIPAPPTGTYTLTAKDFNNCEAKFILEIF